MQRYEREIREILEKLDTFVTETPPEHKDRSRERGLERDPHSRPVGVPHLSSSPSHTRFPTLSRSTEWLTSRKVSFYFRLMLGGLGLVLVALLINEYLPNLTWVVPLVGGLGAFIFISPVLARFFRDRDLDGG